MTKADRYLVQDIHNILENGYKDVDPRPKYEDGTPAHTISVNHVVRKYDLAKGEFPICTLRPQAWKTGIREIFTIYQHPTNSLAEMREMGVTWWDPWDIGDGTIGQRYGATVKRYDLINGLISDIKKDPYGRRKVMSLWQESDLRETPGLAPCAFLTIWNVRGGYLDMSLIQRSGDMLTASGAGGVNEIQYAALQIMVARVTGLEPGVFTHFVANEQIYDRHFENAQEMLRRAEREERTEREGREETSEREERAETSDRAGRAEMAGAGDVAKNAFCAEDALTASKRDVSDLSALPRLVLHKEAGCAFTDITLDDFEMLNYSPLKPQLHFELGI